MDVTQLFSIALGAILVNNFIFSQFLGICPFMGVSKKVDTALGMGLAVTFVMGLSSAVCWIINEYLLVNPAIFGDGPNLAFMQTIAFILVIASLVQFVEMFLKKNVPSLVLLNVQNSYNFIESVVYGITGGLGFLLAIFLFASVRERLDATMDCPKAFEGFPIALVTAGLIALAFMGFSGLSVF